MSEAAVDKQPPGGCCKRDIVTAIREWVIREQMQRVGVRTPDFEITQGYLLCLSNLIEHLQIIEHPCHACSHKDPAFSDPDRSAEF